ncbi:MAG: hypothetical protein ABIG66_03200 [Candidatus Kerfeldbacteria bacterium]
MAPEQRQELGITAGDWDNALQFILEENTSSYGKLRNIKCLVLLDPTRIGDIALPEELLNELVQGVETALQRKKWNIYADCAALMKIVVPEEDRELHHSEEVRREIRAELEKEQGAFEEEGRLSQLIANYAILDAERIDFTEEGRVHCTPRTHALPPSAPLPERSAV